MYEFIARRDAMAANDLKTNHRFGGERGIRSLGPPLDSVTYTNHIAGNARNASVAVEPCSFLLAEGADARHWLTVRRRASNATARLAVCRPPVRFGDDAPSVQSKPHACFRTPPSESSVRGREALSGHDPTQMSRSASPARQAQRCEEPFITGLTCKFREERIVEVDHSRCARGVSLFKGVQCRLGLTEAEPSECEIDR
jgi:hypothetical protein